MSLLSQKPVARIVAAPARPVLRVRAVQEHDDWNRSLVALGVSDIEQGWEWGEVMREDGWRPYRYSVDGPHGAAAMASVLVRRLPFPIPGTILYAPRAPVLDASVPEALPLLLDAVRRLADRTGGIALRVSPGARREDSRVHEQLVGHGFRSLPDDWTTWNTPRIVVRLSLAGTEEELTRRVRKTTRQEIAAAARRGVTIRAADSIHDLRAFHGLVVDMGIQKRYPVRRIHRFVALWRHYIARGDGVLLLAEHEGSLVGGIMGVRLGRHVAFQTAAVCRDGSAARLDQGPLLYWELIRWAKRVGADTIDWGGSGTRFPPEEKNAGYGVYKFKASFGSSLVYWTGYYDLVFRPALYSLVRRTELDVLPRAWRLRGRLNRYTGEARRRRAAARTFTVLQPAKITARMAPNAATAPESQST